MKRFDGVWQKFARHFVEAVFVILLLLNCTTFAASLGSTVVGIDFGSEFIKIAYAAADLPVMLNDISERKTRNLVSIRNGQAFYGPHAVKPLLNAPEFGYAWMTTMLGKPFDSPEVQQHLKFSVAQFKKDDVRGTVLAKISEEEYAPIEYVSGMLFAKLMEWTELHSGKKIRDAVITIPPYFTQSQRKAVLDVAKIAGLNVLSLSNGISTAALYCGVLSMSKDKEAKRVILFDSGATHSAAALVHIDPNYQEEGKSVTTLVEVKHLVWDTNLSGLALDRTVAEILAEKFEAPVPMGKSFNRLLVEATRVKHVLSANSKIRAHVEDLIENKHLSVQISRQEMEGACIHLRDNASELIKKLLAETGIDLNQVHAIIPIGGNSRVPFVQEDLKKTFGSKVQFVLNMDEAIAQGAALYAASLSHFRVKSMRFRDSYPFAVDVVYGENKSKVPVYPRHALTDGHKGVAFRNMDSIEASVHIEGQGEMLKLEASGLNDAVASLSSSHTIISSKLKFWVDLTTSGIIQVADPPIALIEYENLVVPEPAKPTNSTETNPDLATAEKLPIKTIETKSIPLQFSLNRFYTFLPKEQVQKWAKRIQESQEQARLLTLRATAKNSLESNFYRLKDSISLEKFDLYCNPEELKGLNSHLEEVAVLLEDAEDEHTTEEYEKSLDKLLAPEKQMELRMEEESCRPAAVSSLKKAIDSALRYVEKIRLEHPDPETRAQTDDDLVTLEAKAQDLSSWLNKVELEQSNLRLFDDPAITCGAVEHRAHEMRRIFVSVSVKKLPERPKPTPEPEKQNDTEAKAADQASSEAKVDQENVSGPKDSLENDPALSKNPQDIGNEEKLEL